MDRIYLSQQDYESIVDLMNEFKTFAELSNHNLLSAQFYTDGQSIILDAESIQLFYYRLNMALTAGQKAKDLADMVLKANRDNQN